MRQVIMWNLITLDGFFEGTKSWDLDWHNDVWGNELERLSIEQTGDADMILFGRVTYEGMAQHWPTATGQIADIMNRIPKVVFSRTLERADWNNTRLGGESAEEEVARLKKEGGRAMLIFGSARLCASLMRQDLIDEYRLCVVPLVLEGGVRCSRPMWGDGRWSCERPGSCGRGGEGLTVRAGMRVEGPWSGGRGPSYELSVIGRRFWVVSGLV